MERVLRTFQKKRPLRAPVRLSKGANWKLALIRVRRFTEGKRPFRYTVLPLINEWPAGMKPAIRQEIEAIMESALLSPQERQAVKTTAIALWKAGRNRMLKDRITPEVMHALGVAKLVEQDRVLYWFGVSITLAAILHDALEDGIMDAKTLMQLVYDASKSRRTAGEVATIVRAMTHELHMPLEDYRIHARTVVADPRTRFIKAKDLIDRPARLPGRQSRLFETEREKTRVYLEEFYKVDYVFAKVLEESARRHGLLP